MAIVFPCSSCGTRFEVDDRFAGKAARCQRCGQKMTIPQSHGAPAEPALKLAPAAAPPPAARRAAASRAPSWIDAVNSQVSLAPLSVQRVAAVPAARAAPTPLDDASFSGLYQVRSAPALPPAARLGKATGPLFNFYRRRIGDVQHGLRWLNDAAYLVSVPFLVLLILGAMIRNRPLALFAATVVVLLNLTRLATGLANLVAIPFRDGLVQGIMFLIPPLTFVYIAQHSRRLRKPLKRVVGPAATIAVVGLVFAFVPWLSRGEKAAQGDLKERLNTALENVREDVAEQSEKVRRLDAKQLEQQTEGVLKRLAPAGADAEKTGSPEAGTRERVGEGIRSVLEGIRSVRPEGGP